MNLLSNAAQLWWEWMRPMFWQAGLLILIVSLIDRLFQDRLWPQVRYALWILVLVKLVLPPNLAMPTSLASHARPGIDRVIAAAFAGLLFAAVLLPMAGPPPDARPAAAGTTQATDPDGCRERLQAVADAMASEWRTQDLDTHIQHWDEGGVLNGNTTRLTRGRSALRKTWAEQKAAGVHILNMNFFVVAAERCGDRILETGANGVTFRVGKGPEILNDSGKSR